MGSHRVHIIAAPADPNGVNADVTFTTYEQDFSNAQAANQWALRTVGRIVAEGRTIHACTVSYDPRGYAMRSRALGAS